MNEITGLIEKGTRVGSKISYPTINVVIDRDDSLSGVYVCDVEVGVGGDHKKVFGAGYVGEKDLLPKGKFICEVFLFGDFGELYGEMVRVKLLHKIRDVQKIKNLEELSALISNDVKEAKKWLELNV